ncbi:DUF4246 domain-containing protein [Aspergillus lucknowensis]|uniref:Uncharacterized protein n=1 Tax=Aspergillus lucknowensis TaxID=176173 RepID=A0ABR4LDV0_9EURO
MLRFMESITDKPDWDEKVFREDIASKWRDEMANSGKDVSPQMINWIIKELQWKAGEYQELGYIECFDPGVIKSDIAIPSDLQQALKDAVRPLEDIPPEDKDYHPNSNMQVVDLVHPSLFPVIYGRTRIIADTVLGLNDCFESIGRGDFSKLPCISGADPPADLVLAHETYLEEDLEGYSRRFQWLPCDVKLTSDGECHIASYINNLHPEQHRGLYHIIDKILTRTIPLWNRSLREKLDNHSWRLPYVEVKYGETLEPEPDEAVIPKNEYWEAPQRWRASFPIVQPEPGNFSPSEEPSGGWPDLQKQFAKTGLQVIVKLANIELTPERPEYGGGSWHVEGQLNERIYATAIYYYNSDNITENTLSFCHCADHEYVETKVSYEQGKHTFLPAIFGFGLELVDYDYNSFIAQELGGVSYQEGRLLTFPNTLQHCVSPFSLVDRSKPGHRKILALFLIDPNRRVISSANVPPQKEDWFVAWQNSVKQVLTPRLPRELQDIIHNDIDFKPITMDEAKQYQEELMEERSTVNTAQKHSFKWGGFSLCEH